uniref:Uncharacterized protein n=1 Tax=Rhizophora mucronata TaxID=61149 RepID=A0A2P2NVV2_RHIMU
MFEFLFKIMLFSFPCNDWDFTVMISSSNCRQGKPLRFKFYRCFIAIQHWGFLDHWGNTTISI